MARLIDATRIEQYILNNCSDNEEINAIYAEIINAPTVDAVPLEDYRSMEQTVYKLTQALAEAEPIKHGHWIYIRDEENNGLYECSECHKGDIHAKECKVSYCWNCGAKMDEVGE